MSEPEDGRSPLKRDGFSYLPHFITQEESAAFIEFFGGLWPIWERRHDLRKSERAESGPRRLTRPVYWLGAWQFASLGYYAEPDHRQDRCLRAEGFPPVMRSVLERLAEALAAHERGGMYGCQGLPNTCLINYYGREVGLGVPRDYARLRMHRDGEPGPVIMFNFGQAGLLEFLDPARNADVELGVWARHRSVCIVSGPEFKDRLYHRVSQVRTGKKPEMNSNVENFELRRVSVSFRHVPESLISDFSAFPVESKEMVRGYVEELAQHSGHFRRQITSD